METVKRPAEGRVLLRNASWEGYERTTHSRVLPPLRDEDLGRFVEEGLRKERPEWMREVRRLARSRDSRTEGD